MEGGGEETGDTASRAVVRERVRYTAWGIPTRIAAADINWDGVQDQFDVDGFIASQINWFTQYVPRADLNGDGVNEGWDLNIFQDAYTPNESGVGVLSGTDLSGFSYGDGAYERKNIDNRIGMERSPTT